MLLSRRRVSGFDFTTKHKRWQAGRGACLGQSICTQSSRGTVMVTTGGKKLLQALASLPSTSCRCWAMIGSK